MVNSWFLLGVLGFLVRVVLSCGGLIVAFDFLVSIPKFECGLV